MITWSISQMERKEVNGFVIRVYYSAIAVDGNYSSSFPGVCNYTQSGDTFIPYEDLTQDEVIGWVKESLGADKIISVEAELDADIAAQKQFVVGVPWPNEV